MHRPTSTVLRLWQKNDSPASPLRDAPKIYNYTDARWIFKDGKAPFFRRLSNPHSSCSQAAPRPNPNTSETKKFPLRYERRGYETVYESAVSDAVYPYWMGAFVSVLVTPDTCDR